jgi:hypothetical protein
VTSPPMHQPRNSLNRFCGQITPIPTARLFLADKSPFLFFCFLTCAFTHHHDGPHRACLVLRCVPSRLPVRPMQARAIEQTNRNRQLQRGLGATPGSRTASTTASARVEQEAISRISWTFIAAKPPWRYPFHSLLHSARLTPRILSFLQTATTNCCDRLDLVFTPFYF